MADQPLWTSGKFWVAMAIVLNVIFFFAVALAGVSR